MMAPKCAPSSKPSDNKTKHQRKMLIIQEKVKLLDMIKDGKKIVEVALHYDLNESTIHFIRKDEKNICARATVFFSGPQANALICKTSQGTTVSFNKEAKHVVTSWNKFIVKTESALAIWINDSRKKNIPLDSLVIGEKARQLYPSFTVDKPQPGPSSATFMDFMASKGWFKKFQKTYHLKSVILHGEVVSADQPAAEDYVNNMFQKDLVEMTKSASEEEEEQPEVPRGQEEEGGFILEHLSQVVRTIKLVQDTIGEWDPQTLRFQNALDGVIEPYKSLLMHMKRQHQQLPLRMFFSRAPSHPLPTPSAPSAEEDDAPAEDTAPPADSPTEVVPSEEQ